MDQKINIVAAIRFWTVKPYALNGARTSALMTFSHVVVARWRAH